MTTNKLSINYSIAYSNGTSNFTITWASIYSPVTFSGLSYTLSADPISTKNFLFGPTLNTLTTLDWTKCTSPSGSSRTDLINKIIALVTNSTPTFNDETLTALTANSLVATDANKTLTSNTSGITPTLAGLILPNNINSVLQCDGTGNVFSNPSILTGIAFDSQVEFTTAPVLSSLTASSLLALDGGKNVTNTTSGISPTFTGLNLTGLTASTLVATDGSKNLTSTVSGLSPTFTGLNLTGLTSNSLVATDGSKNLTSTTSGLSPAFRGFSLVNGYTTNFIPEVPVGNESTWTVILPYPTANARVLYDVSIQTISGVKTFSAAPVFSSLTASSLLGLDGSKNVTSSVSGLSPTFTGINLSGLTASSLVATDGSKNLTSTVSGLSPTFSALTLTNTITQKRYYIDATNNGSQSITSGSVTNVSWGETVNSSNPPTISSGTVTPNLAGYWLITYCVPWNTESTSGIRQTWINKNGSDSARFAQFSVNATSGAGSNMSGAVIMKFNGSSDTFAVRGFQNSGGGVSVGGNDGGTQVFLNCHFLHE